MFYQCRSTQPTCCQMSTELTLRSSGARGLAASVFYRHCAPLERKTEPISDTAQSMDFQIKYLNNCDESD